MIFVIFKGYGFLEINVFFYYLRENYFKLKLENLVSGRQFMVEYNNLREFCGNVIFLYYVLEFVLFFKD